MNFLNAQWSQLIMANYEISPEILQPYVPAGTELDFFEGKTYVSLVGFMFLKTRIFGIPIPGLGNFEEINLRFYVLRKEGDNIKRGVVFINETVPSKIVAWLANKLYQEHYTSIPTRHVWKMDEPIKEIEYFWKIKKQWNFLKAAASAVSTPMSSKSIEEFIFEHYWGYSGGTRTDTTEYEVGHPTWLVNDVQSYSINCNFTAMYGKDFGFLAAQQPASVFLASGSPISVKWKRNRIR